jgi:hypothetical protein
MPFIELHDPPGLALVVRFEPLHRRQLRWSQHEQEETEEQHDLYKWPQMWDGATLMCEV